MTRDAALAAARHIAYDKWLVFKQAYEARHPLHIGKACQHAFVQTTDSHGYAWQQNGEWKVSGKQPGYSVGEFWVVDFDGSRCFVEHEVVEGTT